MSNLKFNKENKLMYSKIISEIQKEKPYNNLFHMHIPKIGGTSLYTAFEMNDNFVHGGHKFCVNDIPNPLSRHFGMPGAKNFPSYLDDYRFSRSIKFAVIRNPFEWLLSYYLHFSGDYSQNTEHRGWGGCVDYHGFRNFHEFINAYCDPEFKWHIPPLRNFIPSQLFDENGNCRVDFVLFTETLDSVIDIIAQHFNFKLPNNFVRKRVNPARLNIYEAYNDEMLEKVSQKCKRELDLFGYSVDGLKEEKIMLPYDGICLDLSSIKYDIYTDKLNTDNLENIKNGIILDSLRAPTTFWPEYHYQRYNYLLSKEKYTDAEKELEIFESGTSIPYSDIEKLRGKELPKNSKTKYNNILSKLIGKLLNRK